MTPAASWGRAVRAALPPLALAVGLVLLGEVLLYRLPWSKEPLDLVGENGRLEWGQMVFLVGFGLTMAAIAARFARVRPLAVLLAGLAAAVLVREQNNVLKDHVGHGVWQALVAGIVAVSVALAWPSRRHLPGAVLDLLGRPAAGLLMAAVAVFAYAQLFDELTLWRFLLGRDEVPYAARRVTEEGVELAAYVLAFAAAVAWRAGLARSGPPGEHVA